MIWLALAAVAVLAVAGFLRGTVFASGEVRRLKWKTLMRLRPGAGFATAVEVWWRWGKTAVVVRGRRARPSYRLWRRVISPGTACWRRLGRAQYGRRVYADPQHQVLILAPPRAHKTAMLGDWLLDHQGAAVVTESRLDLLEATAGPRSQGGRPIHLFNPDGLGGYPSTFRWAMVTGCADPAEAQRRARDLSFGGAADQLGENLWWVEKAGAAVAAGMHAADLLGASMLDVHAWSQRPGANAGLTRAAQGHQGASAQLFGALAELDNPGKAADSIRLFMSKALEWLAVPDLAAMVTGGTVFDVAGFIRARGTVYMEAQGGDEAPGAPLFRCFASYVHRQARLAAQSEPGRVWDPRLLFALDELHLCPVPAPSWLADSGGSGVDVVIVVHSPGQLVDKYGQAGLTTVQGTTGLKIFLPGNHDVDVLDRVSRLAGKHPEHEDKREMVAPVEFLQQLPDRRAMVFWANRPPLVVKVRPYWCRPDMRWRKLTRRTLGVPDLTPAKVPAAAATVPLLVPGPDAVVPANGDGNGHGNGNGQLVKTGSWPGGS